MLNLVYNWDDVCVIGREDWIGERNVFVVVISDGFVVKSFKVD